MPRWSQRKKFSKRPREGADTIVIPNQMVIANRVASLLAKWPGNAPRAFWEAMKEGDSTEVAMAIVMDPSYGLEKETRKWELKNVFELGNREYMVPLHLALWAKRPDVVSALLVSGADPNYKGYPTLSDAYKLGDLESFEALIAAGATIEEDMMFDAARGGNADIIKLLAAKGLSVKSVSRSYVDDETYFCYYPIHLAASKGHTAAVEAILDLGGYVDAIDDRDEDHTALTLAIANGHIETVKLLVARGADISLRPCGYNALDEAVKRDNFVMVKTLLALGADPKDDEGDRFGDPVYSCNNVKSVEVAKLLASHGAVIKLAHINNVQLPEPVREYYFQQLMLSKLR